MCQQACLIVTMDPSIYQPLLWWTVCLEYHASPILSRPTHCLVQTWKIPTRGYRGKYWSFAIISHEIWIWILWNMGVRGPKPWGKDGWYSILCILLNRQRRCAPGCATIRKNGFFSHLSPWILKPLPDRYQADESLVVILHLILLPFPSATWKCSLSQKCYRRTALVTELLTWIMLMLAMQTSNYQQRRLELATKPNLP